MTSKDEQRNIKAIRLLQKRSDTIEEAHNEIDKEISTTKRRLAELGDVDKSTPDFAKRKQVHLKAMSEHKELPDVDPETIYNEAEAAFPEDAKLDDILTAGDWKIVDKRIATYIY